MATKKIQNKNTKINYKLKFKTLEKEFIKLQAENLLLKSFNQPRYEDKVKILDDYYSFCEEEDYDANKIHTYIEYKKKLKNQDKFK